MPEIQERQTPDGLIRVEPFPGRVTVRRGELVLATSDRAVVLRERDHLDRYYLPREDVRLDALTPLDRSSFCPWKGTASDYWALPESPADPVAWSYPAAFDSVAGIRGRIAFYDEKLLVEAVG
ncbi:MAG: DUF427 domain-containing protein [Microbacterium sp.]|uniref:DUF427 domain-containing protein n=1 Tax=Microbacterium sp. TaxID=51671 RepID=UPI0039E2DFE2